MKKMWGVKKIFSFMFLALTISILLTACGGGGGGDNSGGNTPPPSGNTNATITGTVAGTTVKAFDLSGNEVASSTATGNPKTFSLNVPAGGSYKFYLIENEGTSNERVYALYQGNTNVFIIASAVTIDLGFVDTSTGVALPTNNPLNQGASDGGTNTTLPSSLAGSAFTISDLQGTWNWHQLWVGDNNVSGWVYGTVVADGSGNATVTCVDSSFGCDPPFSATFTITTSGVVSDASDPDSRIVMAQDKNMMVGKTYAGVYGYDLIIFQKAGGTFSQSDLTGTWNLHRFWSGDGANTNGWMYGTVEIAADGSATVTCGGAAGVGSCGTPYTATLTIDVSGVVSRLGYPNSRAVMSQDKSIIVGKTGEGNDLLIMQKGGGATFSQTDLEGTWNMYRLTSGDSPQWNGWTYGSGTADSSGNMTWAFINRSNGDTSSLSTPMQLAIGSTEVVTDINRPSFHGVMSLSKDLIVATNNHNSTNGYNLWIFMK